MKLLGGGGGGFLEIKITKMKILKIKNSFKFVLC